VALFRSLGKLRQRSREAIQIFTPVLLGYRDQQAIGEPWIDAAQIEAGDQACCSSLRHTAAALPPGTRTANSLKNGALPKPSE